MVAERHAGRGTAGLVPRVLTVACAALLLAVGPAAAHEGGTADYRWADGRTPVAAEGRAAALLAGQPAEVWTPDGQAVLTLPGPALAGAADTSVPVGLHPVDPATLGRLPDGLAPASNAYRVELDLAAPGSVLLATAHPATAVLRSSDGERWERLPHQAGFNGLASAPLEAPGLYLVATEARHVGGTRWPPVVSAGVGVALLAAGWRRRRAAA